MALPIEHHTNLTLDDANSKTPSIVMMERLFLAVCDAKYDQPASYLDLDLGLELEAKFH